MALTGKLLADFSSFSDAVRKADVELKGMETSAGKVGSSLNRMVDNFSGRKLIQDASLAAEAVERIGGTSKLTESELQRVGSQAAEAAAKLKAMGVEVPPGIAKIAQEAANAGGSLSMADKAAGLLKSTFGQFTAANIVSNLLMKATDSLGEFVAQGSKLPGLQASFNSLTKGIGQDGTAMLNNMTAATKGLVSNYDLLTSANKAMLLGLPVTSASMGDLSQAATTLGRAMGQDATKSLDDLITALGRSSPMILDNLGLTVKVGEANEAYAVKLGKAADKLTDAEKKMAFYEAAMEAARKKTQELGEQSPTLGEMASSAWTKIGNVVSQVTADMNTGIGRVLSRSGEFAQFVSDVVKFGNIGAALNAANLRGAAEQGANAPSAQSLAMSKWVADNDAKVSAALAKLSEEWKKQDAAAKKAAESYNEYVRALSGAEVAEEVQRLARAHGQLLATGYPTMTALKNIANAAQELREKGGQLTPTLSDLADTTDRARDAHAKLQAENDKLWESWNAAWKIPKNLQLDSLTRSSIDLRIETGKLHDEFNRLPDALRKVSIFMLPEDGRSLFDPDPPRKTATSVDELSRSLSQLAQVAGGTFGQVASGFATMVASIDTARKGYDTLKSGLAAKTSMSSVLDIASGISGIVSAAIAAAKAIKAVWSAFDRDKGRDLVEDFAESFGGFDALHRELNKLGEAGEALWIKLTQGVGRNNPEQAQRAIEEVEAALAKQKAAQEQATISTEEGAKATIETATEAQKALDELSGRLLKNADEWGAWSDAVMLHIQKLADGIRSLPPMPPTYTPTSGMATVSNPGRIINPGGGGGGSTPAAATPGGTRLIAPANINLNGRELWAGLIEVGHDEGVLG